MQALGQLRRSRCRTRAVQWRAWQDAADPEPVLEQFVVGSWEEHERQHARLTERDKARLALVESFAENGIAPTVRHWVATTPRSVIAADPRRLAKTDGPDPTR
jgi:hypothetical protein